jgi:hypothetical protein
MKTIYYILSYREGGHEQQWVFDSLATMDCWLKASKLHNENIEVLSIKTGIK